LGARDQTGATPLANTPVIPIAAGNQQYQANEQSVLVNSKQLNLGATPPDYQQLNSSMSINNNNTNNPNGPFSLFPSPIGYSVVNSSSSNNNASAANQFLCVLIDKHLLLFNT
jgi:hypothetical protein